MNNKEQFINILTQLYKKYDGVYSKNAFDTRPIYQYYWFDEIKTLEDADIDKIIQLYQSKTNEPMSINTRLLLLDCVYETIADNEKYQALTDKLIDIYKIELENKLTKPVKRYDDFEFVETDEMYQASYTTMPEYSLKLANMCAKDINKSQPSVKTQSRIATYNAIKSDFEKIGQKMPEIQEQISQKVVSIPTNKERENQQTQVVQQEPVINKSVTPEVNIESIIYQIKENYPDVIAIEANGAHEYEGQYKVNVTNFNGMHTSIDVSKDVYDNLKNYFKKNPSTISTHINKPKEERIQPVVEQSPEPLTPEKKELVTKILTLMINNGDFHDSGIDIGKKTFDIERAKENLKGRTMKDLQFILSTYTQPQEEMQSGKHR